MTSFPSKMQALRNAMRKVITRPAYAVWDRFTMPRTYEDLTKRSATAWWRFRCVLVFMWAVYLMRSDLPGFWSVVLAICVAGTMISMIRGRNHAKAMDTPGRAYMVVMWAMALGATCVGAVTALDGEMMWSTDGLSVPVAIAARMVMLGLTLSGPLSYLLQVLCLHRWRRAVRPLFT